MNARVIPGMITRKLHALRCLNDAPVPMFVHRQQLAVRFTLLDRQLGARR